MELQTILEMILFLFFLFVQLSDATVSRGFQGFCLDEGFDVTLFRLDLAPQGSFGGGNNSKARETGKNPVVFIHGPTSYAGHLHFITDQFKQVGYTESELFGTTYGEKKDVFETTQPNLYCSYVKLQRDFIKAVAKYTQRPVDVVAFSVGAVIARKAILGGTCAESDENLGEPLTATVRNFISVGGPHHGRAACNNEGCDQLIGLWCHSKFIADLKDKLHYEGSRTISLWSSHDDYIGYKVCDGEPTAQIEQSDVALEIPDLSHQQLIWFITPLLIDLINGKNVTKEDAAKAAFKALLEFNKNPRPWPYSSRHF